MSALGSESKGLKKIARNERERRLLCFEQICPTESSADFEEIERLSESFISPQRATKYSLDRISVFGSKLLDFAVGERKPHEPERAEGPLERQESAEDADFPSFRQRSGDKPE